MALCAASVAGICLAADGVESANIVGYQEYNGTGTRNYAIPTFLPPGTDGATLKLGDIKVNDAFEEAADNIVVYNGPTKVCSAYYLSAETTEGEEGWYDADALDSDEGELVCINSQIVGYGAALIFNRVNPNAALCFAGEVANRDVEINGAGTRNFIGNCAPVDLVLGDIKVNDAFEEAADNIVVYNGPTKVCSAYYLSAETTEGEEGWYDAEALDSDEGELVCINLMDIPAGSGFIFNRINPNAAVIIPSAIK